MPDPILEDIFREHLPYEIDMLRDTYRSLVSGPPSSFDMNVLIESFCVHARSLLDFFSCNKKNHDDAISTDFTSAYAPTISIDVQPLKSIRVKLNKQVFHLTTNRTIHDASKFDPSSDGSEVLRQIEGEIVRFTNSTRPEFGPFKTKTARIMGFANLPPSSSSYSYGVGSVSSGPSFPKLGPTGPLSPKS